MGNQIDVNKIHNILVPLSHKIYLKKEIQFINKSLKELIDIISSDLKGNKETEKFIIEVIINFSEDYILNLLQNLVCKILYDDNKENIFTALDLIMIIIDSLNKKHKHLKEIIFYSLNKQEKAKLTMQKNDVFPFNLINLCLELICNGDSISKFFNYILKNIYFKNL